METQSQLLSPLQQVVLALQPLRLSGHIPPTLQLPSYQLRAEEGAHHFCAISLNGHFLPGEAFPGDFLHICCDKVSAHRKRCKQELYVFTAEEKKSLPETD